MNTVLAMLNTMIGAGVERNATYELRAKVFALKGQGDDSMRDLTKAVLLGWRRAWWAAHEPYFASLQSRSDFQALMTQVSQSNEQLIAKLKTDQPDYFRDLLVTSLSCIPNTKAGKLRK